MPITRKAFVAGFLCLGLAILGTAATADKAPLKFGTWTIIERSSGKLAGTFDDWNPNTEVFTARWLNGFVDYLHLDKFTDSKIELSGFNTIGDPVHFTGTRKGQSGEGTATVTLKNGGKITWSWGATW